MSEVGDLLRLPFVGHHEIVRQQTIQRPVGIDDLHIQPDIRGGSLEGRNLVRLLLRAQGGWS